MIDNKWVMGNLFKEFDETLAILKQFIGVSYETTEIEREEIWQYRLPALHEALPKALAHRDYFNAANFIQIKMFDDHIWFSNPAGVLKGIIFEDLKRHLGRTSATR